MFINPKTLLENKIIIPPTSIDMKDHLQQNGIDIDCFRVFEIDNNREMPYIGKTKSKKATVREVFPVKTEESEIFVLEKGKAYTFDSSFGIAIPENMCGWIVGRSSLNRQGILIRSSWYDSGFQCDNIGATIYCFNNIAIEKGARIAQIILSSAEAASLYNGQYQKQ